MKFGQWRESMDKWLDKYKEYVEESPIQYEDEFSDADWLDDFIQFVEVESMHQDTEITGEDTDAKD